MGSTAPGSTNSWASSAWKRARGTWSSLSRRGISAPSDSRTSRSRTSALVATLVAVSKASVSIAGNSREELRFVARKLDRPAFSIHVRQTYRDTNRRERSRGRLRPLHEADRVLEVQFHVTPLCRGKALETVEIEVRDVGVAGVPVSDREGRARDRDFDAERPARATDERRLAGTELPRDGDDVAGPQPTGKTRSDSFCLSGRRRPELERAQNRPS